MLDTARRLRRHIASTAVFIMVAMVAASCGARSSSEQSSVRTQLPESSSLSNYFRANAYVGVYPSPTASLNIYSPDSIGLQYWALEPLAIVKPPNFVSYIPALATSWHTSSSKVTIKLRKGARYQDGEPIDSADVVTSMLVNGIDGGPVWSDITGLSTPNSTTLVLDVKPGVSPGLALYNALGVFPVAMREYKKFVPAGMEKALLEQDTPGAPPQAAKEVGSALKKLEAFAPKRFIGDGPFEFAKKTAQEAVIKKWPGFWNASKIHVPGVTFTQYTAGGINVAIWAAFRSGLIDFSSTGATYQAVQLMRHAPGGHVAEDNDYGGFSLLFNDHTYPYTLRGVRQAIAYVVNRPKVSGAIDGHSPDHLYPATKYLAGMSGVFYRHYLSPAQVRSLNPYNYDPAKAASLLRGLGFHKRGGQWYLPNGKPFTIEIQTIAGEEDSTSAALSPASLLTNFGIKAKATDIEGTTEESDIEKGTFQMAVLVMGDQTPLAMPAQVMSTLNFSTLGRGIGFGPKMIVPGLGNVNIPKTLSEESNTVSNSSARMAQLVRIWVDFMNKEVPYLYIDNRNVAMPYSTARFTDWPPLNSSLWKLAGPNPGAAATAMMQRGYIRPKS